MQKKEGIVIKTTGSWLTVRTIDGVLIECRLRGNFRTKGIKATNPVAVGDKVQFQMPGTEGIGFVTNILPRKNYIIRKSTKLSKLVQVIAANIDQAYVIVTLAEPRTSTGFIDRFLITAEAYSIPANIIFNKIDIYNSKMKTQLNELSDVYSNIGYGCYHVSALKGDNLEVLINAMKGDVSLFAGHSGVGKSALLNAIQPELNIKTGEISDMHLKGKHTTTFAEMHELNFGGYIIDTPGIKEFGVIDFYKEELSHYFPEIFKIGDSCRFNNCTHTHEPDCAVIKAVEAGEIYFSRYQNYYNIMNDNDLSTQEWELR